ncbi:hypothetical protein [Psychrobacter frigidicola]|uniref:hypothetical protein n=1 Tax=Psychrobacter frigidicola TaxID=45611 RepID=UPI001D13027B|nr:hypothetical protein [Psychrobacter frigidicola]
MPTALHCWDWQLTYVCLLSGLRDEELPSRACILVKSLLELGEHEQSALHQVERMLAGMETYFTNCFTESQRLEGLDKQLDPVRFGRRLQAEVSYGAARLSLPRVMSTAPLCMTLLTIWRYPWRRFI